MTHINHWNRFGLTVSLGALCILFTMLSTSANAASPKYGWPACLYFYENAGKQKLRAERSCFTLGGHGAKVMGGGDHNFKKLHEIARAYKQPVQYVRVGKGHTVELHYKDSKGKMTSTRVTKNGPIDIRRGALKGVRIWKTSVGRGKHAACLYESKASLKKKKLKHAICLPFGEYRNLDAYGWDDKAKYIDLKKGYKAYLYKNNNFEGNSTIIEKTGRIRMEGKNKSVSSIRIQKK